MSTSEPQSDHPAESVNLPGGAAFRMGLIPALVVLFLIALSGDPKATLMSVDSIKVAGGPQRKGMTKQNRGIDEIIDRVIVRQNFNAIEQAATCIVYIRAFAQRPAVVAAGFDKINFVNIVPPRVCNN